MWGGDGDVVEGGEGGGGGGGGWGWGVGGGGRVWGGGGGEGIWSRVNCVSEDLCLMRQYSLWVTPSWVSNRSCFSVLPLS